MSKRFPVKFRTGGLSVSVYPYGKRNEKTGIAESEKPRSALLKLKGES